MLKTRRLISPVGIFLLVGLVIGVAGCAGLGLIRTSTVVTTSPEKTKTDPYTLALDAYFSADFNTAADLFTRVGEQTTDPLLARRALFGLACARLMTADSQAAFKKAMDHWSAWVQAAPQQWNVESPLLFIPLINEKFVAPEGSKVEPDPPPTIEIPSPATTWLSLSLKMELEQVKTQLHKANGQLAKRQKTIKGLNQEIKKLKEQIKAIELIDQTIQEKKKAIPATE